MISNVSKLTAIVFLKLYVLTAKAAAAATTGQG